MGIVVTIISIIYVLTRLGVESATGEDNNKMAIIITIGIILLLMFIGSCMN